MNELICFGSNLYGQCGNKEHGKGRLKITFNAVQTLKGKHIELAECGAAHSVVKTGSNDLFSFGLNDKG